MNENIGDGLHLGVSIDNVKNQHITKYESEALLNVTSNFLGRVPLMSHELPVYLMTSMRG